MSTDYKFEKEITMEELFDGRLESFGVIEKIIEGGTSPSCRLLVEGSNGMRVHGDEVVNVVTRCGSTNSVNILNAITDTFDTRVMSEHDPQFWGFETEEEWQQAEIEAGRESRAEFYIEIMKFVRGESNDIQPGTVGFDHATIAKKLIAENPDLALPDQETTLMDLIHQGDLGDRVTTYPLTEDKAFIADILGRHYDENNTSEEYLGPKSVNHIDGNEDSLTATFRLTMMFSVTGPVNQTIILGDERPLIDPGHDEFGCELEVIDCGGLIQLRQLIEASRDDEALILGYPQEEGEFLQSTGFTWGDERVTNARDQSLPLSSLHLLHFRASETSLMVFEVNNSGKDSPEVAWDILCEIDPQLRSTGYLLVYSPCSNIIEYSSGIELTGSENFHFYCLVKNGADIPRYGRAFVKRSWLQGYGRIDLTESGEYLERQIANVEAFHPNQTMCESPPTLGDGLIQNRPGMCLRAGGILDTEKLEDLNYIESLKHTGLVEETKNPSQESWVQARASWVKMKSSYIAKYSGCDDEYARCAAECAGDTHILPGIFTLNFEQFGWVSVTEMLFDAHIFDQQTLADPIRYSTSRFVATFEWNDGDPRIRSFVDGECVYGFTPTEIDVAVRYGALQKALSEVGALWWGPDETKEIINLLYGDRDLL